MIFDPRWLALLVLSALSVDSSAIEETREMDAQLAQQKAKLHLQNKCLSSRECAFNPQKTSEGWNVSVQFYRLLDDGQAASYPGGHTLIVMDKQGRILREIPGE